MFSFFKKKQERTDKAYCIALGISSEGFKTPEKKVREQLKVCLSHLTKEEEDILIEAFREGIYKTVRVSEEEFGRVRRNKHLRVLSVTSLETVDDSCWLECGCENRGCGALVGDGGPLPLDDYGIMYQEV